MARTGSNAGLNQAGWTAASWRPLAHVATALATTLALPDGPLAQGASGPRVEVRVEGIAAARSTVQFGAGFNAAAGNYTRWGLVAAAGVTEHAGRRRGTARLDLVARFLLDPFYESRRGLYGLAGLGVMDDGTRDPEPRVFVGVGLEGSRWGPVMPALELTLGGGVRFAGVLRRPRASSRR